MGTPMVERELCMKLLLSICTMQIPADAKGTSKGFFPVTCCISVRNILSAIRTTGETLPNSEKVIADLSLYHTHLLPAKIWVQEKIQRNVAKNINFLLEFSNFIYWLFIIISD